jgi:5-methylcytosine-specific restriction endonuclease McrA
MSDQTLEREAKKAERRPWYASYLQSNAWLDRRDKVLDRAKGLCEGCRERPAQEVHHLSYDNVGAELLYQLVALCKGCHGIAHAGKVGGR